MKQKSATKSTLKLYRALKDEGIKSILEFWDGYKHIDIHIPDAKVYIEIDGLQHYTNHAQIIRDFTRDRYSNIDKIDTLHIPNEMLENHLEKIVKAIVGVVKKRKVVKK
jgi:very-short-patch-repair endonuclease